jgi:hypothetical protein
MEMVLLLRRAITLFAAKRKSRHDKGKLVGSIRKRSSRYPPEILRRVARLAREGWGPSAIRRLLLADEDIREEDVPDVKTVGIWRKRELTRGSDEPWLLSESSAEEARLILPALVDLLRRTEGRLPHLTKSEAQWVYTLRRAQPRLPPWEALKVARRYIDAIDADHDQQRLLELDRYVALGLWGSGPAEFQAVELGIVSRDLIDLIDDGGAFGDPVYRLGDAIVDEGSP